MALLSASSFISAGAISCWKRARRRGFSLELCRARPFSFASTSIAALSVFFFAIAF